MEKIDRWELFKKCELQWVNYASFVAIWTCTDRVFCCIEKHIFIWFSVTKIDATIFFLLSRKICTKGTRTRMTLWNNKWIFSYAYQTCLPTKITRTGIKLTLLHYHYHKYFRNTLFFLYTSIIAWLLVHLQKTLKATKKDYLILIHSWFIVYTK